MGHLFVTHSQICPSYCSNCCETAVNLVVLNVGEGTRFKSTDYHLVAFCAASTYVIMKTVESKLVSG